MTGEVTIVTNSINDKKIKIGFFTYYVDIMNIYFFPPITMIEKTLPILSVLRVVFFKVDLIVYYSVRFRKI